jgi:hypothetical protein
MDIHTLHIHSHTIIYSHLQYNVFYCFCCGVIKKKKEKLLKTIDLRPLHYAGYRNTRECLVSTTETGKGQIIREIKELK